MQGAVDAGPALRPARPDDAAPLAALDARAGPWPWSEANYRAACEGEDPALGRALLLDGDGGVLAAVVYSRVLDLAEIQNVVSDPDYRRQGLARRLLEAVLAQLRAEGAERCMLEVRVSNAPAIALYRRLGFAEDGLRRNYYPLGRGREDALLMSLQL